MNEWLLESLEGIIRKHQALESRIEDIREKIFVSRDNVPLRSWRNPASRVSVAVESVEFRRGAVVFRLPGCSPKKVRLPPRPLQLLAVLAGAKPSTDGLLSFVGRDFLIKSLSLPKQKKDNNLSWVVTRTRRFLGSKLGGVIETGHDGYRLRVLCPKVSGLDGRTGNAG